MDSFYERHVLHSLGIAKVLKFQSQSRILDVGTGGGFPGIPLAILFPEVQFELIDSIRKKIKVVQEIGSYLELKNINAKQMRAEQYTKKVDFVVSRAVAQMGSFVPLVKNNISPKSNHKLKNGILYLKGGDLTKELKNFPKASQYSLYKYFDRPFFETKKIVHLSF
jgi:16S rRNA (guanine527-N7)-methyltransferase